MRSAIVVLHIHRLLFLVPRAPLLSTLSKPSLHKTLRPLNFSSAGRFKSLGFTLPCRAMSSETSPPPSPAAAAVQVRDTIDLTDKERQIFDRLLQVVRRFNLQIQLRVAGGWVRDKLLGKECYDIDIALDTMYGKDFCEKVNEYLSSTGEEARGIGVIQCNPDQSKHLETARMRLFDIWIDFVNLRSEDYSENSRIPTMNFGTPENDAYRRDLTINSLFYNINANLVEDLTGRGISDLKSGKIVTPLQPKKTFLDDPLRVLRAIRFGARFSFKLDDELKKAAADDDVKAAISDKISRERIGHEIDLMVSGNEPVKAIKCISDLLLFWVVFSLPPKVEPPVLQECDRICVAYMDAAWNLMQSLGCSTFTVEHRRLGLYAALFLPLRSTIHRDHKSKKVPVVSYIFRNSLKLKASDAETVMNVHSAAKKFESLLPFLTSDKKDLDIGEVDWGKEILDDPVASKRRVLAGLLLREIKDFWRVSLLASLLLFPANIDPSADSPDVPFDLDKRTKTFLMVEKEIIELGLEKVWEMKPLVNGKDIMGVLELKSGGPLVKEWQQKLLQWQLARPSGTSEECLEWMRESNNSKRARTDKD